MSLSTQLSRGALALPMLVMFAGLGVLAGQTAEVDPAALPVQVVQEVLLPHVCGTQGGRTLVLAQAPADLGNLVIRWNLPCRA